MPYTEDGLFYHDRRLDMHTDTWKRAAENLALHIETYLFDEKAPGYMKPEFLSWALAVYDATKNSSGNVIVPKFDDPEMKMEPIAVGEPAPGEMRTSDGQLDKSVRFSQDAFASKEIDTDMHRAADNGYPLPTDAPSPDPMIEHVDEKDEEGDA